MITYCFSFIFFLFHFYRVNSQFEKKTDKLRSNTVMAHRGFWGYYPEHSIRGFELAYFMGADYLETDINMTKDGELIIHHDSYLDDSTDVNDYPEYERRRRTDVVDGIEVKNKLFVSDFTFEEIQKFHLVQRNSMRPQIYNKDFKILKFETLLEMTISNNKLYSKSVGIYVEPKSIEFYKRVTGMDLNEKLLTLLVKYELNDYDSDSFKTCPIVIQSFEFETLAYFKLKANLPQVALMRWRTFYNYTQLAEVSDALAPDVDFILYERIDDNLIANGTHYETLKNYKSSVLAKPFKEDIESLGRRILNKSENEFVKYAVSLGKHVQIWNLNNDSPKFSKDPVIEYSKMCSIGVNALFSDFCDTALFATQHYKKLIS